MTITMSVMIMMAAFMGTSCAALARVLSRGIIIGEGRTPPPLSATHVIADAIIISAVSFLAMVSFAHAEMGSDALWHAIISGLFGALLAAAAWSDARTSIVPDTLIGGALSCSFAISWMVMFPESGPFHAAIAALIGIITFAAFCAAFQNLEGFSVTPSDASFMLIMITTPHSMAAIMINAVVILVAWMALTVRPEMAKALVSPQEKRYLEEILTDVYGENSSRRRDWLPVGPLAIVVITSSLIANLAIALI